MGIVIFGMANGFALLPIILSFIGPLPDLGKGLARQATLTRRKSIRAGQPLGMPAAKTDDVEMAKPADSAPKRDFTEGEPEPAAPANAVQ